MGETRVQVLGEKTGWGVGGEIGSLPEARKGREMHSLRSPRSHPTHKLGESSEAESSSGLPNCETPCMCCLSHGCCSEQH